MVESLQRLVPPRRLGKFLLTARRGEGGMATVYVAAVGQGPFTRLAAVKLLRQGAPDHDFRTRFLDEAKVVVRLHHNNIVDVREAGEVDEQLYIAMELIEGRDLADIWDRCAQVGRAFPVPLAVHIVRDVLRGLHYAHAFPGLGLVHRDVSPSNVLIDWAGAVRLADFGLATSAMKASLTVPGMVFGKVGYMAPEQATRSPLDGRADVYSCGVVLWELLTGRPMRDTDTDTQAVAGWEAISAASISSRVDAELEEIVMASLSRPREDRYQSAGEFMEALSVWISKHAPDTTQERLAEFMIRLFDDACDRDHEAYASIIEDVVAMKPEPRSEGSTNVFAQARADAPPGRAAADLRATSGGETIEPGTIIAQRYRIAERVGRGGMGTVYLAEHVTVGRKVAIKVLTYEWSEHEVVARRFKEEARAASAAGHPNIIEVFDAGELPDGRLFIVMEYLRGGSLYEELVANGPMDALRACRCVRDVARAIRAAHGVGVIHRDLKPDNVMIVNQGEVEVVKVLDFGISASSDRTAEEQRLTIPGSPLGTPEYMAPEQCKGDPPTELFDIYALGVILYEVLAGDPPFVSKNIVEILTRKSTEAAPPLEYKRDGLPPPLVQLVHACIEVEPERRPESAEAFLAELEPIVATLKAMKAMEAGEPVPVPSTALALPARRASVGLVPRGRQGVPPPPAYDALAVGLSRIDSGPSPADSVLSTPVDFSERMVVRPSRGWQAIAIVGVILLALLTTGVWWQITRDETPLRGGARAKAAPVAIGDGASVGSRGADADAGVEVVNTTVDPGTDAGATVEPNTDDGGGTTTDAGSEVVEDKLETAKCRRTRQAAKNARERRAWREVLSNVSSRTCWKKRYRGEYIELRIKALFESQEFAKCAGMARSARSPAAKRTAKMCQQRAEMPG